MTPLEVLARHAFEKWTDPKANFEEKTKTGQTFVWAQEQIDALEAAGYQIVLKEKTGD